MASAICVGSRESTVKPQRAPLTISFQRGKSEATTGIPAAMYSNIFTGSELR